MEGCIAGASPRLDLGKRLFRDGLTMLRLALWGQTFVGINLCHIE